MASPPAAQLLVWITKKRCREAGCQVSKGEEESHVVFHKELEFDREREKSVDEEQTDAARMAHGCFRNWKKLKSLTQLPFRQHLALRDGGSFSEFGSFWGISCRGL